MSNYRWFGAPAEVAHNNIGDVYRCDSCGLEMDYHDMYWFTSSIGFCDYCYNKLHKRVPDIVLEHCYECCESGSADQSNECAEFIINMASENPIM